MHTAIILLLFCVPVAAQSVSTRMGARAAAMANAGFVLTDGSSLFNNVGTLAHVTDPSCFFAYDRIPALPGADRKALAVHWPLSFGTLAAGAFRFGDALYNEQLVSLGAGHRIDHTALGIKANYLQYRADGFSPQHAFTLDVAGLTELTPAWTVGAGIFNITQSELTAHERLPVIVVAGVGWKAPEGVLLSAEVEKKMDAPVSIRYGMEITIHKKFFVRTGIGTGPLILAGGLGAKTPRVQADFATSYQSNIGFSYQASASCRIAKKRSP